VRIEGLPHTRFQQSSEFKLYRPRNLNLAAPDELLAAENLETIQLNGFELSIDEDAPVGQRVKLVALPMSKDTQFGPAGKSHRGVSAAT
jgi:DNA mismatch repair ATPase MutL